MIKRCLREWDRLLIDDSNSEQSISRSAADELADAARTHSLGGPDGEMIVVNGARQLAARQVVGILQTPNASLEILPKIEGNEGITRRNLVHMLSAVLELEISPGAMTSLAWQKYDLLEILIRIFCEKLFEVVRRGLPRRYRQLEDDLPSLRGRLDVKRQFSTLAASPQTLACIFDELSSDIAINQIMKATVAILSERSRSPGNQRLLAELAIAFIDVSMPNRSDLPWSGMVLDRTNRPWHQLVNMAKLLLSAQFQTTSSGTLRGYSLLFEMNTLFEQFIGRAVRRAFRHLDLKIEIQGPRAYALTNYETGTKLFATRPDIVIGKRTETLLIIDTKWKRLKSSMDDPLLGVSQSDIYQMMAYSHVYGCEHLMLLYPHASELAAADGIQSSNSITGKPNSRISIATIDISEPWQVTEKLAFLLSPIIEVDQAMRRASLAG